MAPAWQGLGHGRALLQAVQARAQALGLASLWLEVRQSNLRARALYRRYGFAEVGLRRAYYPAVGGREDAVVMRLDTAHVEEGVADSQVHNPTGTRVGAVAVAVAAGPTDLIDLTDRVGSALGPSREQGCAPGGTGHHALD